jgi:hypothetical protein
MENGVGTVCVLRLGPVVSVRERLVPGSETLSHSVHEDRADTGTIPPQKHEIITLKSFV